MSIDLKAFKTKSSGKKREFTTFLKGLHNRKVKNLDFKVRNLHTEVFEKTDCLSCGNCCKTMTPTYTITDIKRISLHLKMSVSDFKEKYLYLDKEGDWINQSLPCPFLAKDNKCEIYEMRPLDCRSYPHTGKKDFLWQRTVHYQNMEHCPAAYSVVEKLQQIILDKS